jgi:phosphoribosylanthranilate isomerase
MRTRIKICGFTRVEDAVNSAKVGVDAIGLVFYPPSPRNITISLANEIVSALPPFVTVVGLFVDEKEDQIRRVLEQVPIDCLQFHGDEPPEACKIYGKRYIKAIRMQENVNIPDIAQRYADADGLLLDAYHLGKKGGTGNRFDWGLIPKRCGLPVILAGGLDASNIKVAIEKVRPYAVDVSSGVEIEKGIKSKEKMAAFMAAMH